MTPRLRRTLGVAGVLVAGLPAWSDCGSDGSELRLVGTVERTLIELVAPAAEEILEITVQRGDRVDSGHVVVRLDPTLAEAEIAAGEAALAGARTGVVVAEHDVERLERLYDRHVISEQELERAQLARAEAQARLREAEARLRSALKRRLDLDLAPPVPGVMDQIPFDPGERVPAGAVVAVVLADDDPWVRVWVPERHVAQVVPGTPAEIRIDGVEGPLRGSVLDVARQPEFTPHYALTERDRVYLVYETRVRILDAPASLRPGVPAEVRIHLGVATAEGGP